ncbi:hypothetical protein EDD21DRAFT_199238 [Dissophora ornata]|nr:hypothetical protein EDD21DRAFT_199238 [Dissophora ornata]
MCASSTCNYILFHHSFPKKKVRRQSRSTLHLSNFIFLLIQTPPNGLIVPFVPLAGQMIDDNQLTAFVNGLCCLAMFLIVAYHFVTVNSTPNSQK